MSDVETIIINDQYIIMVGITLLFTVLALAWRKITLTLLASMCWFISAATHLAASPATSPLFGLVWLYFGIGTIFLVAMFSQIFEYFNFKKKNRMEGPLV